MFHYRPTGRLRAAATVITAPKASNGIRVWTQEDRTATAPNSYPWVTADWTAGPAATIGTTASNAIKARPQALRAIYLKYAAYFWPQSWIDYNNPLAWFRSGPGGYAAARAYAETFWAQFTEEPSLVILDHEEFMSTFRYPQPHITLDPIWQDPSAIARMPAAIAALSPLSDFDSALDDYRDNVNLFNTWAAHRDAAFLFDAIVTPYLNRFQRLPRIVNYDYASYPEGTLSVNNFKPIQTSLLRAGNYPSGPGSPVLYPYLDDIRAEGSTLAATNLTIERLTQCVDPERIPWLMIPGGLRSNGAFDEYTNCLSHYAMIARACRTQGVTDILLFDWSPAWTATTKPATACRIIGDAV